MGRADQELSRIHLTEPLPCGMTGCGAGATSALLEPDTQTRGLWRLLPLCVSCSAVLSGVAQGRVARHNSSPQSEAGTQPG